MYDFPLTTEGYQDNLREELPLPCCCLYFIACFRTWHVASASIRGISMSKLKLTRPVGVQRQPRHQQFWEQVERLLRMSPGAFFGIPGEPGQAGVCPCRTKSLGNHSAPRSRISLLFRRTSPARHPQRPRVDVCECNARSLRSRCHHDKRRASQKLCSSTRSGSLLCQGLYRQSRNRGRASRPPFLDYPAHGFTRLTMLGAGPTCS